MISIVYSSSDGFSRIAGVSILSVCENSRNPGDITFYMIDNGIGTENKEKLRSITDKHGSRLVFISPPDIEKTVGTRLETGRWHISTFYRLFLASILPEDVERVIYLDCDTIVRRDLTELWETDMKGKWLCGVDDCRGAAYRTDIGLSETDIYINNGVLLIDLGAWRRNNVEKMCADFIRKYGGNVTYVDQGVQNGVLSGIGKSGLLHPKYNCLTVFFAFGYEDLMALRKPPIAMDRGKYEEAVRSPAVVHFQSCFRIGKRPWVNGSTHPYAPEYRMYEWRSPWRDEPPMPDDRTIPQKVLGAVTDILPEKFMIRSVSFAHTKIYPAARSLGRMLAG